MRLRIRRLSAAAALICLIAPTSRADLTFYSQDFEGMTVDDPAALANDGWLAYANVWDTSGNYLYGYGQEAPAWPNGFSNILAGEGGPAQGAQQLVVFSDYNNLEVHTNGLLIESNVYQQQPIGAGDVGNKYIFSFDAKQANVEGNSTAAAFIKTLASWGLTNVLTVDMTPIPATWGTHSLAIAIDADLVGQLLQFGFLNTATHFEGSGIFYDNVTFGARPVSIEETSWGKVKLLYR